MVNQDIINIRGIIIPDSWDTTGTVLQIAIVTYLEEKYVIENNAVGKQLMSYLREKMVLEGLESIDENGRKTLFVLAFQVDISDITSIK